MSTNLLNQENIIKKVYDPPTQALKVTGTSVLVPGVLEVGISAENDSIKIGDGSDFLAINSDGSINVNVTQIPEEITQINKYNEVLEIPTGSYQTLNIYTVPVGKVAKLYRISVSGENIATYTITIDGEDCDKKRTYFGSQLNVDFEFNGNLTLSSGQILRVHVQHQRPDPADFNSRIQLLEYP